ncbi:right-handed parallel beta-helix repeat-containing protein, partial [Methanobrevibacter sp.]
MSNKKLFLIMLITLILITIGGVWASEDAVADNLTSSDTAELSLSDSVDTKTDTYQTNVNTTSQTTDDSAEADDSSKNTNGELLGATGDEDVLGEINLPNSLPTSWGDDYRSTTTNGKTLSSSNVIYDGNGRYVTGQGQYKIFTIQSGAHDITFKNIRFIDGFSSSGSGGAIHIQQNCYNIKFINCTFQNNKAAVGGAINIGSTSSKDEGMYSYGISFINCTFDGNTATSTQSGAAKCGGGAIHSYYAYDIDFNNTSFNNNDGGIYGGVCFFEYLNVNGDELSIYKCNFTNNVAQSGGAFRFSYSTCPLKISQCIFENNSATSSSSSAKGGGDIQIPSGNGITHTIINSSFINSESKLMGGSLQIKSSHLKLYNCSFFNNIASTNGASIYFDEDSYASFSLTIEGCNFTNGRNGRAVYVMPKATINVKDSKFINNTAPDNPAIYFAKTMTSISIDGTHFINNTASTGNGGALSILDNNKNMNLIDCKFIGNTATNGRGGAIYFATSYTGRTISEFYFEGNTAIEGGAIYFAQSMPGLKIQNSNFTNNTATSGKAGAFNVPSGCTNLLLSDLKFKGNGASDVGGALYFAASYNLNIDDGWVFENNYGSEGGAIYFAQSMSGLTVHDVTFKNNTATSGKAGAFNIPSGTVLSLSDLKFIGNDASDVGGALYFAGSYSNFNIDGWVFENNSASQGGAIYFAQSMPGLTIQNSNFTNNKAKIADASLGGGAIFIPASSNGVTIYRSNFTGNNASSANGGAIFFKSKSSNIIIEESVFDNNNALSGGAIQFFAGNSDDGFTNIDVIKSNFTNNKATQTGSYGGAAITFNKVNDVDFEYCIFDGNYAVNFGALMFDNFRDIYYNRCNFTNNNATDGGAIYYKGTLTRGNSTYIKCYFDHNWANGNGAAIYTLGNNVIIMNSTFTNNHAESWAGVIQMGNQESGFATDGLDITDSLFINNTAWNAGAVDTYGTSNAHIIRCLFDNNAAVSKGGAVYMTGNYGLIDNCNFTNNNASDGSAVAYIPPTESSVGQTKANITNCNFINNTAASSQYGRGVATVWFESSGGKIISCNFTNNSAEISAGIYVNIREVTIKDSNFKSLNATTGDGGAVYVENDERITGTVITNCTFSDTHAYGDGGAIYNNADETTVEKCNFTDVTAGHDGGAIYLSGESGTVSLCNFTAGHADNDGGAIYFNSLRGIISYCKFINNTALNGGAIVLANNIQTILNSTFIGNNATGNGGAIYSVGKDVLNIRESIFANNTANNGGAVYYTSFTGNNPNGLVIYNNTFIDNFAFYNGGAVDYVVNGTIPYRDYNLFNNEGVNASGRVTWVHDGKELIHTSLFKNNIDYYMNVSSIIEGNKAIGIIVNVSKRFNKTTTEINITVVNSHGQTVIDNVLYSGVNFRSADWVDEGDYIIIKIHLTRQPIGDYNLTLGIKDDNHNYKEQKINYSSVFTEKGDFVTLQEMVNNATELYRQTGIIQVINLDSGKGYYYDPEYDGEMGQAQINITAPVIINGNGVTIDAHGFCRIFDINADNVTINNIVFKNGNASGNMSNSDNNMSGGAILWRGSNGTLANSTFLENCAYDGGAVFVQSGTSDTITNCEFENNIAEHNGGAVDWNSTNGNLINSRLHDNKAAYGGAVFVGANGGNSQIYNSVFTNNNASERGGAVDWYASSGDIVLSTFINNHADAYGGAVFVGTQSNNGTVYNSTFNSNTAGIKGGAIDWNATGGYVNKSFFYNNVAQNGGAIFVGANSTAGHIINSVFEGNNASLADGRGGAVDWYASSGDIENSNFTNNNAAYGGAVFVGHETDGGNITNSRFESNTATVNGGAVDWNASTGHLTHSYFYDNTANENGGALYIGTNSTGGSAYNNTFVSNSAQNGGAVAWNAANGIINASKFYNNTASQNGGAVFVGAEGTQGHIVDSVFDGNNATSGRGGAVDWYASSGEIYNTTFNSNRGKYGAAVYIGSESHGGNITLSNFTNNEATEEGLGGAIYWDSTNGNVRDSTFRLNNASMGGAIYVKDSDVEGSIVNSTFEENYATGIGGAVYLKNVLNASISNSTFKENSVDNIFGQGGALYIDTATNFLVNDTKFISNEAFEGAVKIENSNGAITGSEFENNDASYYGGIYISDSESVNVTDTTFTQNDDESNMGIYVLSSTDILLDNLTFNYNGENPLPAIMIRGDVTLNDIEINNWNASSNNAAILFSSGESTVNDSVISGNKAIRVNNAATVYLNRLNNTDAADGDYSVLNYGTLYLNMNNFTNVIINHGNIMTKTTTRILDNGTLEIILNHDAELNASIVDDNNNIIIVPDYKFTANGVICSDLENYDKYHFGTYTSPQQGVYVISFNGDLGLKNNTVENGTLKVKDPNTRLVVNSTQDKQGEIVTVKAYIIVEGGIDPSGNVSFTVNGVKGYNEVTTEIINGTTLVATLVLNNLTPDTYFVTAVYNGDDTHVNCQNDTFFVVNKRDVNISIAVSNIAQGENATAIVTTNANGTVVLSLNGRKEIIIENGIGTFDYADLAPGNYTIYVDYAGNTYYNSASNSTNFTVYKYEFDVKIGETQYNQSAVINITLPEDIDMSKVKVFLNNNDISNLLVNKSNGLYQIVTDPITVVGNYTVNVTYDGDDKYYAREVNGTNFTVTANSVYDFEVTVSPDNIKFGDEVNITITGPAGMEVNVTLDGEIIPVVLDENGTYVITRNNLTAGDHRISANTTGDENYTSKEIVKTFTVYPANPEMTINVTQPISPNSPANVTVTVGKNATGMVYIKINGTTTPVEVIGGVAVLPIDTSKPGDYFVTAQFVSDDDNYKSAKNLTGVTYTVERYNTTISSTPEVADNNNVTVTVIVNGTANGSVVLILDNNTRYEANVTDGVAVVNLGIIDDQREYTYNVTYSGDSNLNSNTTTGNFTVGGLNNYTVNVTISDTQYGDNTTIKVTIDEPAVGGTVTVYVDETPYVADLVDGVYVVVTPALAVGNYTVNVTYEANAPYADKNNTGNILTVKTNSSYSFIVDVIPAPFGEDTVINITGPAGENVTVTIDGVEETVTLDENGTAIIKRDNLTAGPHTV